MKYTANTAITRPMNVEMNRKLLGNILFSNWRETLRHEMERNGCNDDAICDLDAGRPNCKQMAVSFESNPDIGIFFTCIRCIASGGRSGDYNRFQCFSRTGEVSGYFASLNTALEWMPEGDLPEGAIRRVEVEA